MLSGQEIDIFSSFGPSGRSKVIENVHGGSRVVTKDGQQILECCLSDPRSQNSLHRTLLKMCCSVSEEYGDGSLTTLMIASHIVARLGTLAGGDSNSCIQWVLLLQALETICSTIEALKVDINTHMTDSQIWTNSNEDESATSTSIMKTSGYLKGLWGTILQPATNTATAAKIEDVIVSRYLACHIYQRKFPCHDKDCLN
jgi:chaperonin GroEL (HSP60 family)